MDLAVGGAAGDVGIEHHRVRHVPLPLPSGREGYSELASFSPRRQKLGIYPVGEFGNRLEESLAIMRDADTMRRLAESDAELARGREVSADELAETIRHRQAGE
jgi:hypothetical protein